MLLCSQGGHTHSWLAAFCYYAGSSFFFPFLPLTLDRREKGQGVTERGPRIKSGVGKGALLEHRAGHSQLLRSSPTPHTHSYNICLVKEHRIPEFSLQWLCLAPFLTRLLSDGHSCFSSHCLSAQPRRLRSCPHLPRGSWDTGVSPTPPLPAVVGHELRSSPSRRRCLAFMLFCII